MCTLNQSYCSHLAHTDLALCTLLAADLFQQLETRDLTHDEEAIIQQRVTLGSSLLQSTMCYASEARASLHTPPSSVVLCCLLG